MPSAPSTRVEGVILDVPRGVTQIGQFDVVTLNKGARDGLQDGNVLAVYKTGETVRDRATGENVKIGRRSGLLMVFRTYDKLSYGTVLQATRSLSVKDKVRNPELRKPRRCGAFHAAITPQGRGAGRQGVSFMPAISPPSLKPGCVFICCRNSVAAPAAVAQGVPRCRVGPQRAGQRLALHGSAGQLRRTASQQRGSRAGQCRPAWLQAPVDM